MKVKINLKNIFQIPVRLQTLEKGPSDLQCDYTTLLLV